MDYAKRVKVILDNRINEYDITIQQKIDIKTLLQAFVSKRESFELEKNGLDIVGQYEVNRKIVALTSEIKNDLFDISSLIIDTNHILNYCIDAIEFDILNNK